MNLLDLMQPQTAPPRSWGRWYRWCAREMAWCCIDPDDSSGINAKADTPPINR